MKRREGPSDISIRAYFMKILCDGHHGGCFICCGPVSHLLTASALDEIAAIMLYPKTMTRCDFRFAGRQGSR